MQYTEQVNLALKYAKQTAKQCGQSYIGSEHLLMGLLREESGMASAILKECKISIKNFDVNSKGGQIWTAKYSISYDRRILIKEIERRIRDVDGVLDLYFYDK